MSSGFTESYGLASGAMECQAAELQEYRRTKWPRDPEYAEVEVVAMLKADWCQDPRYPPAEIERSILITATRFTRTPENMTYEALGRYVSSVLRNRRVQPPD